jgi:hypothetical protein
LVRKAVFIKKEEKRELSNNDYLIFYLLTQDSLLSSLKYVLFMDKARFEKFYEFRGESKQIVDLFYALRFLYMPINLAIAFFCKAVIFMKRP